MEQIIARQNNAARPATGKSFILGIARIILELTIVQFIVNTLIRTTGIGLLNLLFYLYAVVLLVRFMARTVAGSIYTLKDETLVLQRLLGDSTVLGVEIRLGDIISLRPVVCGERLHLDYRQVTYIDSACAPGLRMHIAFGMSLFCAGLARVIAGKKARQENGYVVVYQENGKRCACAFRPHGAFLSALEAALPDAFCRDERLERGMLKTYYAKSLRRAFAELYPHVPDAVTQEELAFEREEFALRREARIEAYAKFRKIPPEKYKAQLAAKERKRALLKKKTKAFFASAADRIAFLDTLKKKHTAFMERIRQEEALEHLPEDESGEGSRRRRGRQE